MSLHPLPFSQACENNKEPILEVLRDLLHDGQTVLEIGTGTAQHGEHFCRALPTIRWQCADLAEYHPGIRNRLAASNLPNLLLPIELESVTFDWSSIRADAVFSANTAHIMSWQAVEATFKGVSRVLPPGGLLIWYGPFNRGGEFTSASNARFDAQLRAGDHKMGIRDDAEMADAADRNGLIWIDDIAMPANNRILIYRQGKSGESHADIA